MVFLIFSLDFYICWYLLVNSCLLFQTSVNHPSATPQNGQTYQNNLPAKADEFFECVWPFYELSAKRVNARRPLKGHTYLNKPAAEKFNKRSPIQNNTDNNETLLYLSGVYNDWFTVTIITQIVYYLNWEGVDHTEMIFHCSRLLLSVTQIIYDYLYRWFFSFIPLMYDVLKWSDTL